jgi:hypothetical protein
VDLNNKTGCSEDQVGKFTRSLAKGLNLVSVPLIPMDMGIDSVLEGVPFNEAWFFDSVDKEWSSIVRSRPYGSSSLNIDHVMGFWVNLTEDANITLAGIVPTNTAIELIAGWNLIGFPSFNHHITVGYLRSLHSIGTVECFDSTVSPYYLRPMQSSEFLLPGQGYWLQVENDSLWEFN